MKKHAICVILELDIYDALRHEAKTTDRSIASLVRSILRERYVTTPKKRK